MLRLLIISLFLCLTTQLAVGQNRRIDSLKAVLARHPQLDTFRVNRLLKLTSEYNTNGVKGADSLGRLTYRLAKQLHYERGQFEALFHIAFALPPQQAKASIAILRRILPTAEKTVNKRFYLDVLMTLGQRYAFDQNDPQRKGLVYIEQAIRIAKATKKPALLIEVYYWKAYYGSILSDYLLLLESDFQALTVSRQAQMVAEEQRALSKVAYDYIDLGDYEQALLYLHQLLQLTGLVKQPDTEIVSRALSQMGDCYRLMGQNDQALKAYQQALNRLKDPFCILLTKAGIADVYERKQSPKAMQYARQILDERLHSDFWGVHRRAHLLVARHYLRAHQPDSVLVHGLQVWRFARSYERESAREATLMVAQAYAEKKQYEQAYSFMTRYKRLNDSINNQEVARKTTALRFKDLLDRQQSKIAILTKTRALEAKAAHQQQILDNFLLVALLIVVVLACVQLRSNRQKQHANALLQKQKVAIEEQHDQIHKALTDLQNTQNQLVNSEKMASLGELTAGIAHEIQNPLNFVNNFSEMSTELLAELKEGPLGQLPQSSQDYANELVTDLTDNLHMIYRHGQRASSIVKGMLEHSRSQTGNKQPTDLNRLSEEYLRLAYHGMRAKDALFNCELVTQLDASLGLVPVVAQDISRVLLNLFNNAFYAVKERRTQSSGAYYPAVRIDTRKTPSAVEIRVSDNGVGMSAELQLKIFQPFFTTKPAGEGTGLGLSLSYDIVTKGHGGTLTVHSQPNEGTEFVIMLPMNINDTDSATDFDN